MASISKLPNGRKAIQVYCPDGKRRSLRIGKSTMKDAQLFCSHVEQLVASRIAGRLPEERTLKWLRELPARLSSQLQRYGLTDAKPSISLGEFLDEHFRRNRHISSSSVTVWGNVKRNLIDCFGAGRSVETFTEADADDFRLHLIREGLAEATQRRRSGYAKQFMESAIRRGYIDTNPFASLKSGHAVDEARQQFVERDEIDRVMKSCTDDEFRAIVALSRYGGLRCPSEHIALEWEHVDFDNRRFLVPEVKTEERMVPLFPELSDYLEPIRQKRGPVVTSYRDATKNMRTRLLRAIKRAGLEPWPKLFHNLRASRETELLGEYPMHVVVKWIGNSQPVALKHYAMVRDEDFLRASEVRNQVRHIAEYRGKERHICSPEKNADTEKQDVKGKTNRKRGETLGDEGLPMFSIGDMVCVTCGDGSVASGALLGAIDD